jgi:hypothetical protein
MFETALDSERAFGQHRAMHRTYVRRRLTVLAFVILVLGWGVPAAARSLGVAEAPLAPRGATYVVRSGDTLWDIAEAVAPAEDPRAVVARIVAANAIGAGDVVPGQALIVPRA